MRFTSASKDSPACWGAGGSFGGVDELGLSVRIVPCVFSRRSCAPGRNRRRAAGSKGVRLRRRVANGPAIRDQCARRGRCTRQLYPAQRAEGRYSYVFLRGRGQKIRTQVFEHVDGCAHSARGTLRSASRAHLHPSSSTNDQVNEPNKAIVLHLVYESRRSTACISSPGFATLLPRGGPSAQPILATP